MRQITMVALSLAALAACGDGYSDNEDPVTAEVLVEDSRFVPASLGVDVGTTVRFRWADGASGHNVTPWSGNDVAQPASPGTPTLRDAPYSFSTTFSQAGSYRFYCSIHGAVSEAGAPSGMAGTITVQ